MPNLSSSLRAFDPDQLEQIAQFWQVDLAKNERESMRLSLELGMLNETLFQNLYESLPAQAKSALMDLKANQGQMSWSAFSLRYGEIRAMGPAKRKKQQPWNFPVSTSETLWYRALIGRDFLREGGELEEKAYLPDEFLPLLPYQPQSAEVTIKLQAQRLNLPEPKPDDTILNDICTLLAALRFKQSQDYLQKSATEPEAWRSLHSLMLSLGLIDPSDEPTDLARALLEMPRDRALSWLQEQWAGAKAFNEFEFIPNLRIETMQSIEPLRARQNLLSILESQPTGQWYKLADLITQTRQNFPDLLRDQEQFFSWKIVLTDQPDRAFEGLDSWEVVEGAFIRFLVNQMLPLLGLGAVSVDIADPKAHFFQLFDADLLKQEGELATPGNEQDSGLTVLSTGKITVSDRSPLLLRYQISRFAEWEKVTKDSFVYQLSPRSLSLGMEQGLLPKHLIALLRKHAQGGLPPSLYEAIKQWEAEGGQAKIETLQVLQLANPEILQALRSGPAARWLGEALGPSAVTIKPGGENQIRSALAGLGYLSDIIQGEVKND